MKNPGKYLALFYLFMNMLFAVEASVDSRILSKGDSVTLTIKADGKEVEFPSLEEIAGYKISYQATQQNISYINGQITKDLSKSYTFTPTQNFEIPSFEVKVDGHIEKTKPISIKVKKEIQVKGADYILEMQVNKKDVFLGEPIQLNIVFKRKYSINISELNFKPPTLHDFWTKTSKKSQKEIVGNYVVHSLNYLIFPQKSGYINIEEARMDIGILTKQRRSFFDLERVKWKSISSNDLDINVKPLPNGLELYGDFTISATVDKEKTKANEPINLTLEIRGEGNIDDIKNFKLDIDKAVVYTDKAERNAFVEGGIHKGVFTQKFAIVSDQNYTIPAISLTYFDNKEKKAKTISSNIYNIEVTGGKQTAAAKLEKAEPFMNKAEKVVIKEVSNLQKYLYTVIGFVLGFLTFFIINNINFLKKTKKEDLPITHKIKQAKNDKELLFTLLPFMKKSPELEEIVLKLEENIYQGKSHKIDKKILVKNIEKYIKGEKEEEDVI